MPPSAQIKVRITTRRFVRKPLLLGGWLLLSSLLSAESAKLEFNRDIRPILSENCFQCHGEDANHREKNLRLDVRESAVRDRGGYAPITPGQPDASDAILRILSEDEEERMPPTKSNKRITPEQLATLRRWIQEGATYQSHWAFEPPRRPKLPAVRDRSWPQRELDYFVLARLESEGLRPAKAASPEKWLRRVSLDLTGLPPTPAEQEAFLVAAKKDSTAAYSQAVERLLASPHFGERLALDWLDTARYADTHGFNNDSTRTMWRWRDWVIDAFNKNKPYDQFIIEQLAGDLLPKPSLDQRIATGFGRNHVINSEGGIIEEEYRVEYVADRVRTVSTAWLGLTLECSRCHDHKFDPIKQRDYYRLFAFFNSVAEHGEDGRVANAVPMIPAPTREQQSLLSAQEHELGTLAQRQQAIRTAWNWRPEWQEKVESLAAEARSRAELLAGQKLVPQRGKAPSIPPTTETNAAPPVPPSVPTAAGDPPTPLWHADPTLPPPTIAGDKIDFAGKSGVTLALWLRPDPDNPEDVPLLSSMNHLGSPDDSSYGRGRELRLIRGELELRINDRFPAYSITVRTQGAKLRAGEWHHVVVTYAGGKVASAVRFFVDGREVVTDTAYDDLPGEPPRKEFLVGADNAPGGDRWRGSFEHLRSYPQALDTSAIRDVFLSEALPRALAAVSASTEHTRELGWLREALLADDEAHRSLWTKQAISWENHLALRRSLPTTMVMQETAKPRPTFILNRGVYNAPGDPVEPGVPEELLGAWPKNAPRNRLGLAYWLTQPSHPLTARVVVNRFWAHFFGTGLVKTLEDFGSQGEWPSHPELLDSLAHFFVEYGWDVKRLLRVLVLSSTYQQDSAAPPELIARDPENRLLARGPRYRLPAEIVRDQALAVSGLLTNRVGGPSVFPYQPERLYEGIVVGVNYPGTKWLQDRGPNLYRRSLYTFWKRTVPHPAMIAFDAPDREVCTVRRSRTNTPLQALVLWNETGYVEAARQLGIRLLREGGDDDAKKVAWAFRLATSRSPTAQETRLLTEALTRLRSDFAANPRDAEALLKVGESPADPNLSPAELAAATGVASMILNLDETVTKN